ncbi:MAG: HAMP domain-containing protein [Thermodesulfobacteriota bacterium]|nr:HAMP domain-containing protein [Thermodesulfobacteriota bacterium]
MIVICEECGKRYRIDPEKIKGEVARFKCRSCNHVITVSKPEDIKPESPPPLPAEDPADDIREEEPPALEPAKVEKPDKAEPSAMPGKRSKGLGLRGKMILLFFLIPIILMAAAGIYYMKKIEDLSSLITVESSHIVRQMAENAIAEHVRGVAIQLRLLLLAHPELKREDFDKHPEFREVARQKVGLTGYTAFYEFPGEDGIWRCWSHPNNKIIGIDMSKLRKPMGRNFDGFWKIFAGVKKDKESRGYYTWLEKDGSFRDKYMVCTPVKGTPYAVGSTTYIDEFTKPIKDLETRANNITLNTRNINFGILVATLILIGVIVLVYGYRLTGKIKTLTEAADRISVGELDTEIEIKSRDEIGDLSNAIGRMQDSIRLSIERLRRRR